MKAKMKAKNIKEARELIKKYRSFSEEEIKEKFGNNIDGKAVAVRLTGFGYSSTCILCNAVRYNCKECIYQENEGCTIGTNKETYYDILLSETPKELIRAFGARANHIEKLISKIRGEIKMETKIKAKIIDNLKEEWLKIVVENSGMSYEEAEKEYDGDGSLTTLSNRISNKIVTLIECTYPTATTDYFETKDNNFAIPRELFTVIHSDDAYLEAIEDALFATGRFTTEQCSKLADGIKLYLEDAGYEIIKIKEY